MGYIETNAENDAIIAFYLVKIDFPSGTLYLTDSDLPVYTNAPVEVTDPPAQEWTSTGFRLDSLTSRQGDVGGVVLSIDNADNFYSAIIFGANVAGSVVTIWEAWLNPSAGTTIPAGAKRQAVARIQTPKIASGVAVFALGPYMDFPSKVIPRRKLTPKGTASYKDAVCQSKGTDTTCLRTLVACQGVGKGVGVSDATNASPIVVTTAQAHGFANGSYVNVVGVLGNTAANGTSRLITVTDTTHFSIDSSTGNGAYAGGGNVAKYPFTGNEINFCGFSMMPAVSV